MSSENNRRCLVICHKQLGDMTLLEPALAKLASAFGGRVELLTRSGHAPLISLMPGVKMIPRPWLRRFDAVFCYDDLDKSAVHAIFALSPRKDLLLRSSTEITKLGRLAFNEIRSPGIADEYLARYNWNYTVVPALEPFRPPRLDRPPDSWHPGGFDRKNYLLLNSTAGWKSKRWKSSSWIHVLQRLFAEGVEHVVVTSGNQDWQVEHAQRITNGLGDRATFLGGRTRLEEFLWLVAHSRMVLGVDGAASHLAAAFGGRSLTLFFRTNPHNWHLPTENSIALLAHHSEDSDEYDIDPGEVFEAAIALWRK